MDGKILSVFLAGFLSICGQVSGWGETYRGAVVEYQPVVGVSDMDTMLKNTKNFVDYVEQARRKGVDIIVFPEYGLFSKTPSPIPDPVDEIEPCTEKNFETTPAVQSLSCASKSNRIYSVINLPEKRSCEPHDVNCPDRGYYIYNTNVVFDRRGVVIARYAKYNLFASDQADQPAEVEMGFFDTDFGVRFGMFICFDILFPTPALKLVEQYGIRDFLFPTFWYSELPFLTALQAQRGWAEANNVNLLAAGANQPRSGSFGSGIYNGKYGHLVQITAETGESKLLVADVPKIKQSPGVCQREAPFPGGFSRERNNLTNVSSSHSPEQASDMLKDVLSRFTTEVIKEGKFERRICTPKNFCCDFQVTMDRLQWEPNNFTYRAVVYSGVRQFGSKFRGGAEVCGIVACPGTKLEDCGNRATGISGLFRFKEISITGNFKWRNSFQMPSTLAEGKELKPLSANKYEFTKTEKDRRTEVSLQLLWPVVDLHTFAIWGRDFTRDNERESPESSASILVSMPVLFGAFVYFLLFVR